MLQNVGPPEYPEKTYDFWQSVDWLFSQVLIFLHQNLFVTILIHDEFCNKIKRILKDIEFYFTFYNRKSFLVLSGKTLCYKKAVIDIKYTTTRISLPIWWED